MSTTTFNLKNPHTGHIEDVSVPASCPQCGHSVSLGIPNEDGNIELRCNPCGWGEDFVPFPEDTAARPGPRLTKEEREAVHFVLHQAELYSLADKFA